MKNRVLIYIWDKASEQFCWAVQHWDDHEVIRVDLFSRNDQAVADATFTIPAQDLYDFIVGYQKQEED